MRLFYHSFLRPVHEHVYCVVVDRDHFPLRILFLLNIFGFAGVRPANVPDQSVIPLHPRVFHEGDQKGTGCAAIQEHLPLQE